MEVARADRRLGIGSTYEAHSDLGLGTRPLVRWSVVEHEPPERTTHRAEGVPLVAALDAQFALRPLDDGTEVTLRLRYRPRLGPLGWLAHRLTRRRLARRLNGNLVALAAQLES